MQYHVPASEALLALVQEGGVPHFSLSSEVAGFVALEVPENTTHEDIQRIKADLSNFVGENELTVVAGVALAFTAGTVLGSIAAEIDARLYSAANENTSQEQEDISHSLPTGDATISISATQDSDAETSEVENGTTEVKEVRGQRKRR